jgi:Arc/MetJ-type ribon-helix-helix transcriptional regulator
MAVRKIAITLPEEMYDLVERARKHEHRSRSEIVQEAVRTYFGEPYYRATDDELKAIDEALEDLRLHPESERPWDEVRAELWPNHRWNQARG